MAVGKKTGGRKKGTPNKDNALLKDIIIGALNKSGGEQYLITQAKENPTAFMTLIGKVLPSQLNHTSSDGSMTPRPDKIILKGVRADDHSDS